MTSKVIGIISYLPDNDPNRAVRLLQLLSQLNEFGPQLPIMIIAQNGGNKIKLSKNNITTYFYDQPLGILKARQELRQKFLESSYEQIIMFDDDAVISTTKEAANEFLHMADEHPYGFMFLKGGKRDPLGIYNPAQLNGCIISKGLVEREVFRDNGDPRCSCFEDLAYSHLLHGKYPEYEFNVSNFQCIQYNNIMYPNKSTGHIQGGEVYHHAQIVMRDLEQECKQYRQKVSFEQLEQERLQSLNKKAC